jgi:hypothetical protein
VRDVYVRNDWLARTILELSWPDLAVRDLDGRSSRLEQTLVATFDSANQAHFAVDCLRSLSQLDLVGCRVLSPETTSDRDLVGLRVLLGDGHVAEIAAALREQQHMVIVTVGERSAPLARAVLVDDAHSLQTTTLPPCASSS